MNFLRKNREPIVLGLLILAFSIINLIWIFRDTRPLSDVDSSVYLIRTVQFIDNVRHGYLRVAFTELDWQGRPPTYQLLSVPFILLFGRSQDAALMVNLLYATILIISTYGIGKTLGGKNSGLLAAFLIATYPPILAYMHMYRTGFGLPVSAALWTWILIVTLKTRTTKSALLYGASLSFGLLNHPHFIYVSIVPTILFGLYLFLFQTDPKYPKNINDIFPWIINKCRDPFVYKGLLPAALIVAVTVLPWYLTEGLPLLKLKQQVTAVRGGVQVGDGFHHIAPSFWWYVQTMPHVISYVLAFLFGLGLFVVLIKRQKSSYVLVITFFTTYIIFNNLGSLAWKRFSVLLPIIAVITVIGIFEISQQYIKALIIVLCIVVGMFNLSYVNWGENSWNRPIAIALGALPNTSSCSRQVYMAYCPTSAVTDNNRIQEVLETIRRDPSCQTESCSLFVLDAGDYFEYIDFTSQLSLTYPGFKLQIKPFLFSSITRRDDFNLEWLLGDFIVYIPEHSKLGGRYREAIRKMLITPPKSFTTSHETISTFPLSDGSSIQLIKRMAPITLVEAEEIINNLDVSKSMFSTIEEWMKTHTKKFNTESLDLINNYLLNGDFDKAIDLILVSVNSDLLSSKDQTHLFNKTCMQLLKLGEPEKVIELSKLVSTNLYDADTWITIGRAYRQSGLQDQAKSAFESALSIDANSYLANHLLAGMLIGEGDWQSALESAEVAYRGARNEQQQIESGIRLISVYQHLSSGDNACALITEITELVGEADERVNDLAQKLDCK